MKIQVLGSGCPTCARLNEVVSKAVEEMGVKEKVEYFHKLAPLYLGQQGHHFGAQIS